MAPKSNFKSVVAHYFNEIQLNKLFDVSREYPIEAVVKLTGYYGFRRSEVLGLRWEDVNFNDGTIIVLIRLFQ